MTTASNMYAAKNEMRSQSGEQPTSNTRKPRFASVDNSAALKFLVEHQPELEAELCGRSLSEFVARAWPIIEPGYDYIPNWHIDLLCEYLTAAANHQIKRLAIMIPPRYMKLCADSTPVLTPRGWTTHGDLRVGDEVFTPSGKPTTIVALSAKGMADYEVTFTNGERIKCNSDHLWTVYDRRHGKWGTRRTEDLAKLQLWSGDRATFQTPEVAAVEFPEAEQPLPAYFLGAWLGDGSECKPAITRNPQEHEVISRIESLGIMTTTEHMHPTGTSICTYFARQDVIQRLREIGVYGDKHIPGAYKYASVKQRLELMAGLIDTDGSCDKDGRITFANSNKALVEDVTEVAAGLGWKPYIIEVETEPFGKYGGGRKHWHVCFNPTQDVPVALDRKRPKRRAVARRIGIRSVDISLAPEVGNCISVAADKGLYLVGRKCVPTHNSILTSVMWPCWIWTQDPTARFMFASHSDELSTKHSLDRRAIISSPWYQERWGDKVQLAGDNNLKTVYTDTATGVMRAMSVGSGVTGLGGNYLVADDLVSALRGDSQLYRDTANTFFDRSFYNRLDDKKNGVVVVIMQRLHTQDLIGHIRATCAQDNWTFVEIPAEAEQDERIVFPISNRVIERKTGDLLWPEREGPAELAAEKERLGSYGFAAQYQQNPVPREGALAKREWFKIVPAAPADIKQLLRRWDLAATEVRPGKDPDYTASCLGGMLEGVFYILHMTRDRLSPMHVEELVKQCAQLDTEYVLARKVHLAIWMEQEPGSSGVNTIDNYARHVLAGYDFHGDKVTGNKFERGKAFLAAAEAGNVCLVAAPWNEAFLDEMSVLGVGAHDDLYDTADGCFTQANAQRQSHGGHNG
jgi:predicted phage terminase large subunit-like protein